MLTILQVLCVEDVPSDLSGREAHRRQKEAPRVSARHILSCRELSALFTSTSPHSTRGLGTLSQEKGILSQSSGMCETGTVPG